MNASIIFYLGLAVAALYALKTVFDAGGGKALQGVGQGLEGASDVGRSIVRAVDTGRDPATGTTGSLVGDWYSDYLDWALSDSPMTYNFAAGEAEPNAEINELFSALPAEPYRVDMVNAELRMIDSHLRTEVLGVSEKQKALRMWHRATGETWSVFEDYE